MLGDLQTVQEYGGVVEISFVMTRKWHDIMRLQVMWDGYIHTGFVEGV
jgi:hypothetical protein